VFAISMGEILPQIPRQGKHVITDVIRALWRITLMLALNRSHLNREYIVINVPLPCVLSRTGWYHPKKELDLHKLFGEYHLRTSYTVWGPGRNLVALLLLYISAH
jgi:hypothetical protein